MSQSLAPGSQTFEQDLFRLYTNGTITLEEALAHADSPTNLSWIINNSQINASRAELKIDGQLHNPELDKTSPLSATFTEFRLNME
jgi:twitching motility protein PilU